MTQEPLKEKFSQFGEVSSFALMKKTGFNNTEIHFGFVCFAKPEDAKAAESLNGIQEENFTWYVVPHMKKGARLALLRSEFAKKQEDWKRRNIIIRNLPLTVDEEKLRRLCQEFGPIESVKIPMVKNIRLDNETPIEETNSKGIGLVCFINPADSAKAIQTLRNKTVEDRKLLVFPWKPREEIAKIVNMNRMKKIWGHMMDFGMMNPMMGPGTMMAPGRGGAPNQRGVGYPRGRGRGFQGGAPQQGMMAPVQAQRPTQAPVPAGFNNQAYEASTVEVKKRMLGEALYPQVLINSNNKIAGKITGMLLEMDNQELIGLLSNQPGLKGKVVEAIEVLRKAWENDPENLKLIDG